MAVESPSTPISTSTTTNVAAGTVSSVAVAKWLIACLAAKTFIQPDDTTLLILCGAIMPFGQAIRLGFRSWFTKETGVILPPVGSA